MYADHDREEYHSSHGCAVTDRHGATTFHRYSDLHQPSVLQSCSSCLCTLLLLAVLLLVGYFLVALQWQGKSEDEAWQQVEEAADITYNLTAAQINRVAQDPRVQQVMSKEWVEVAANRTLSLTQQLGQVAGATLGSLYRHFQSTFTHPNQPTVALENTPEVLQKTPEASSGEAPPKEREEKDEA